MKAKKTLALLLAAMMAAASLAGCSGNKNPGNLKDKNDPNLEGDALQNGAFLSLDEIKEQIEAKVAKNENDSKVITTLDGYEVTYSEYRYYYMNYVKQFASYYGSDFMDNEERAAEFDTYFGEAIKMNGLVYNAAKAAGLGLTQEEFDTLIAAVYDDVCAQYSAEGLDPQTLLDEQYYISPYYLMFNEVVYNLYQKLYDAEYGVGGEKYEQIKTEALDYFNANGYMRAKHILLQFPTNEDGSEVTEEQKAEVYAKMQEILAKAKNGEDFDALVAEYNEDPGMNTYTGGYYFGEGQMVQEFEDATKALAENEISDIVETPYGYHIILRLPLDDESIATSDKFSELAYTDFDAFFTQKIEEIPFVELEGFEQAIVNIKAEADEYLADLISQEEAAKAASEAENADVDADVSVDADAEPDVASEDDAEDDLGEVIE